MNVGLGRICGDQQAVAETECGEINAALREANEGREAVLSGKDT